VAVSDTLDSAAVGRESHLFGDLVGLGLRSNGACPMELTLLPEHVVAAQAMAKRRPFLIGAAVCLFATLGAWGYYLGNAADAYAAAASELKPKINALNDFNRKFDVVRKEATAEEQRVAPLVQLVDDREYWA